MLDSASPESTATADADWLSHVLPQHPVFNLPVAEDQAGPSSQSLANGSIPLRRGRQRLLEVRSTDVLLGVNQPPRHGRGHGSCEIRIASLLEAKKAQGRSDGVLPSYKTLEPSIPFQVCELRANPTGKLLAVAGQSELQVVILPRAGWLNHSSAKAAVKTVPVGRFYHNRGSCKIAKVDWHPWARGGSSLLVLTEDGILREYDVFVDHEEPSQQWSFLPGASPSASAPDSLSRSKSRQRSVPPRFGSVGLERSQREETPGVLSDRVARLGLRDEPEARRAVSFAFAAALTQPPIEAHDEPDAQGASKRPQGIGWGGWSPLELFAIMQNGDVWKVCPFLPSQAMIPPSFLNHLAAYVDLQADAPERSRDEDLALRYVRSLTREAAAAHAAAAATASPSQSPSRSRARSLLPRGASRAYSLMSVDTPAPGDESVDSLTAGVDDLGMNPDGPVLVTPPHLPLSPAVKPVGPFLLQPAPHELTDAREPHATDLAMTRVVGKEGGAVDILCLAFDDGRLDICLNTASGAAAWESASSSSRAPRQRSSSQRRAGRFTLSDSDDSDGSDDEDSKTFDAADLEETGDPLPVLLVHESIDLGIASPQSHASLPTLVVDPIYADTLYAYSSGGVHAISFRPWAPTIADLFEKVAMEKAGSGDALSRFLRRQMESELVQVITPSISGVQAPGDAQAIIGVTVLSDVYLSYALLAITADLQAIGIELDFRVDIAPTDDDAPINDLTRAADSRGKAYHSLLEEAGAFKVPEPFTSHRGLPAQPRITGQQKFGKTEVVVTPDSLRFLGQVSESLRGSIRDVIRGANAVQARLELQQKELSRQLAKLSEVQTKSSAIRKKDERITQRFDEIEGTQTKLNKRIDTLLQRLIVLHQPEVSIYERNWFDELEQLAADFGVAVPGEPGVPGAYEPESAIARKIDALRTQLDLIRPGLKELKESQKSKAETQEAFGSAQLAKISSALAEQSAFLAEAKAKAQDLLARVGHASAPAPV